MKKFKFLVGAVALFALVVVNVWNAATVVKTGSSLNVEDVEAVAQEPEGYSWDAFSRNLCPWMYSDWWLDEVTCTGQTVIRGKVQSACGGTPPAPIIAVITWTGKQGICRNDGNRFCSPYDCSRTN